MARRNCFDGVLRHLVLIFLLCLVPCVLPVKVVLGDEIEDNKVDEELNGTQAVELDTQEDDLEVNPSWTEYYNSLAERLDNAENRLSQDEEETYSLREDLDNVSGTLSKALKEVKDEAALSNGFFKDHIEQMSEVPSGIDEANKTLKEIKKTIESLKKAETKSEEEDPMVQIIDGVAVIIENQEQLKEDQIKLTLSVWAIAGLITGLAIMRDTFK